MTFPRVRSPGTWTLNSVVSPQEMEQIDNNLTNAIDGLNGGGYAPYAPIVIGAAGTNTMGLRVQSILEADMLQGTISSGQILTVGPGGLIDVVGNSTTDAQIVFGAYSLGAWGAGANALFGAGSTLTSDGTFNFGAGSETNFQAGSDVQITGTSANPATWEWGGHSVTTIASGAQITDAGTHNTSGPWTNTGAWTFSGDTTTFDPASTIISLGTATFGTVGRVNLDGTVNLGMVQPVPTAATGANVLLSTLMPKAWCFLSLTAGSPATILDGVNISGIQVGTNITVGFGTPFATPNYGVVGWFSTDPTQPFPDQTTAVAYLATPGSTKDLAQIFFIKLAGSTGNQLTCSGSTGTMALFFFGRQ